MNQLGKVIDVSDASYASFDQMHSLSKTPIILTHFRTQRWRALHCKEPPWSSKFDDYMAGRQHVIKIAGPDHVCFGAEWDGGGGIAGMQDVTALLRLPEGKSAR